MESRLDLEQTIQTLINRLNDQDTLIQTLIKRLDDQDTLIQTLIKPDCVRVPDYDEVSVDLVDHNEVPVDLVDHPEIDAPNPVSQFSGVLDDLTSKTVKQLKAICREYNIKGNKCDKKSLIKSINDFKNVVENVNIENLTDIYLMQDYEDVLNNACRNGNINIVRKLSLDNNIMLELNIKNAVQIAKDSDHKDIVEYLTKRYLNDLASKTVKQLKAICQEYNIKCFTKCNKKSLIELITLNKGWFYNNRHELEN
jgi:predicted GIY-YIG superfamily endonuclease